MSNEVTMSIEVLTEINYPAFSVGDHLYTNGRVNHYKGEGWYYWRGDVYKVCLKPHGDGLLCAYQINGDCIDIDYEDFTPDGLVLRYGRAAP